MSLPLVHLYSQKAKAVKENWEKEAARQLFSLELMFSKHNIVSKKWIFCKQRLHQTWEWEELFLQKMFSKRCNGDCGEPRNSFFFIVINAPFSYKRSICLQDLFVNYCYHTGLFSWVSLCVLVCWVFGQFMCCFKGVNQSQCYVNDCKIIPC